MNRFVIVALLLMAWAYWELSGGAGFAPESRAVTGEAAETGAEPAAGQDAAPAEAPAPVAQAPEPAPEPEPAPQPEPAPAQEPPASEPGPAFSENPLTTPAEAAPGPAPDATPDATPGPAAAAPSLHVVTGSRVNLREGPGTSFATTGQVTEGTILEVLEIRDGWAYVQLQGNGEQGWMSASFLAPLDG